MNSTIITVALVFLLVVSTATLARAGSLSISEEGNSTIFVGSMIQWFGLATILVLRIVNP